MSKKTNEKPFLLSLKTKHAVLTAATALLFAALLVFAVYEGTKNTVTFTANGETTEVRTHAKTIGAFLKEQKVEVTADDFISLSKEEPVNGDLTVEWDKAEQYTITVDGEKTTAWTTSSNVEEILAKAKISVTEHDKVTPSLEEEAQTAGEIIVEKAYEVTLLDGLKKKKVWSTSTTVADFLKKNGIVLGELDRVESGMDELVVPNAQIQVTRVEKVTDVVENSTKFAVETKKDASLLKGREKLVQKGETGVVKKTYEVIKENGKEVNRKLTGEKVVKAPKKQIVAVGTKTMVASVSRGTQTKNTSQPAAQTASAEPASGREFYVSATAYTASCTGCSGITATGINLKANPNLKVIAVDPRVIPLGSKVWVEGYGYAVAGDTGGAIKGNKIDLFVADRSQALAFGRQQLKVKILN